MSRLVGRAVAVIADHRGAPCRVDGRAVLHVYSHHREWIGALEGEPERDVWRVETADGIAEMHQIQGVWHLARWED